MIRNPNSAMFSIVKPTARKIDAFLRSQQDKSFTYPEAGLSRNGPLAASHPIAKHYRLVHRRFHLGQGRKIYQSAKNTFQRWGMFELGWVHIHPADTPMLVGSQVGIISHVMGIWSINVCRIIYIVDDDGPIVRFGFGYGTLPGHAIRGEERMTIEFNRESEAVHYEIFSFSTESQLIAKITSFHLHSLQNRFARESSRRMQSLVRC